MPKLPARTPFLLAPFLTLALPFSAHAQQPIRITADLTEAPRKLYHAEIDLPVHAGENSFTTPEWIPGNHRPTGPVEDITGVVFSVNGQPLPWRRDDVDLYEFHVEVPKGVTTLHAHLDCIVLSRASDKLAVLEWEKLLLYPAHVPVKDIPVQASVTVPQGWGIGTALEPVQPFDANTKPGGTVLYKPTTVEQLQDSPIIAGEYFHEFPLAPDISPKHFIDVVSDRPDDSNLHPEILNSLNNLVREADKAYGSHHYNHYNFLLTLSDVAGGEGLEHGQSSDNGTEELGFDNAKHLLGNAELLSHEFTHSWNGKYRRPDKLYQTDFSKPEVGELLWVYEGMTQYMGNVLAARDGMWTPQNYRDSLALSASTLDYEPGRQWRSTDDTAVAASILRSNGPAWNNWRRRQDYYPEGELLWLDADTLIRQLTNDQKSLTDFFHIFLAKGGNTGPLIVTYNREELVRDLNQVAKYDWAKFFHDKVDMINPHADLDGINRGGYKLVYEGKPNAAEQVYLSGVGRRTGGPDLWYSLGLRIAKDGTINDVRWGSAADKARLAPGQKLIAIEGRSIPAEAADQIDLFHEILTKAKTSTQPIHLIVGSETYVTQVSVDYHEGERYPVLVRDPAQKPYMDEIITPMVRTVSANPVLSPDR